MQPWKVISGTWLWAIRCEWWQVHGHVCCAWGSWCYPEWAPISSQTSEDFAVLFERVQEHIPGSVMMIFPECLLRLVAMAHSSLSPFSCIFLGITYFLVVCTTLCQVSCWQVLYHLHLFRINNWYYSLWSTTRIQNYWLRVLISSVWAQALRNFIYKYLKMQHY